MNLRGNRPLVRDLIMMVMILGTLAITGWAVSTSLEETTGNVTVTSTYALFPNGTRSAEGYRCAADAQKLPDGSYCVVDSYELPQTTTDRVIRASMAALLPLLLGGAATYAAALILLAQRSAEESRKLS